MNNWKDKNKAHALFQKVINNRDKYFEELYYEYNRLIYQIAFSIVKNKEEAQDITHTIFEKLLQMTSEKWASSNELTWIYSVTKNETINYIKSRKDNINIDELYDISDNTDFTDELIDINVYNKLIDKLKNKEKEVVSLKVLGNLSFKEISKLLDTPIGTIQYRYYKGINSLKLLIVNFSLFCIVTIFYVINKNEMRKVIDHEESIVEDKQMQSSLKNDTLHSMKDTQKTEQDEVKEENNIIEETIQIPVDNKDYNIYKIKNNVLFTISAILIFITFVFLTIFIKYQQKLNLKLSK